MEPSTEHTKKNRKINVKILKKVAKATAIIFTVLIILSFLFAGYTNKIVGRLVEEVINYHSNGEYEISYNSLKYNFLSEVLTLTDLKFAYDSSAILNEDQLTKNGQNIFYADVPYLHIDMASIWAIYFNKELKIKGLRLHDADIIIKSYSSNKGIGWQNDAGSLYNLISDQLQVFKINNLEVKNGRFQFEKNVGSRRKYSIKNVSFIIDNFLLDSQSKSNKEKFFYTDDIDIEFNDQQIFLKDSIHSLYFKKLVMSTTKSEILVDSLVIRPKESILKNSTIDTYNLDIPNITIKRVDFKSAYNDGVLKIGDLDIQYPTLRINDRPKNKTQQDTIKNSFTKLALDYFDNIEVDTFNISNALFSYNFRSKTKTQNFSLNSFNVKLTQFKLDSSSISNSQRPIYYDEIDFIIKDYTFNLPDSIHTLSFKLLTGSTEKRVVVLEELTIKPRDKVNVNKLLSKNHRNKTFNMFFPQVELHRVNGHDFMNTDTLIIEQVHISKPDFRITEYPRIKVDTSKNDLDLNNLYPFITGFMKAVYLKEVNLDQGNFSFLHKNEKLQPIVTLNQFNIDLTNVEIDTNSQHKNKLFSAEDLVINSQKAIVEIPEKSILTSFDEFQYSTFTNELKIKKFDLDRTDLASDSLKQESISASALNIRGLDVNLFLNKEKNDIELLEIRDPFITYNFNKYQKEKKKDTTNSVFNADLLDINHIIIHNGTIDFTIGNSKSIKANEVFFEIDDLKKNTTGVNQLDLGNYNLSAKNLLFSDQNKKNRYSIKSIHYNRQDSGLVLSQILIAHKEKGINGKKIWCNIPKFSIFSWKPNEMISKNILSSKRIEIAQPDIRLSLPLDLKKSENIEQNDFSKIIKINVSEIYLEQGKINISKAIEGDSLFFSSVKFDFEITGLHIDSLRKSSHFLFSENIETSFSNNTFRFLNSPDSVSIDLIEHGTRQKSFSADGVHIKKHKPAQPEISDEINITKAYIEDFDYDLLAEKRFEMGRLLLFQPTFDLQIGQKKKKNLDISDIIYLNAFNPDTNRVKTFKLEKIEIREGNLKVHLADSIYPKPIQLGILEMDAVGFDLRRTDEHRLLKSDNISFSFSGFEYHLPDSLNSIAFERLFFSSLDSSIIIKEILFDPKEEKYEYGHIVGDQTDYLKIRVGEFSTSGIDFHAFLVDKSIIAKKFTLDKMDIYAFRDKRIPRLQEKEKTLPQKYLMEMTTKLMIDSIKVTNSEIEYEEFGEESLRPGKVDFKKLNASIKNITNDPIKLKENQKLLLTANAQLMNEGNLDLYIQFDLLEEKHPFYISTRLTEMDLTSFNKMLEPNAFVTIKKGKNKSLTLSANANDELAIGEMSFLYDDLKVSLVNKNTFGNRGMGPVIGSFFANAFIINKNNPRLLMTKEGYIYFERNKYRSIFNYWAKIFFSGIVSSIGAKSNKKEIKKYEKMEDKQTLSD